MVELVFVEFVSATKMIFWLVLVLLLVNQLSHLLLITFGNFARECIESLEKMPFSLPAESVAPVLFPRCNFGSFFSQLQLLKWDFFFDDRIFRGIDNKNRNTINGEYTENCFLKEYNVMSSNSLPG